MAHHADDQAETVLFNLLRGAAGLRGMAAETEIKVPGHRAPLWVERPLLHVSRAEIDAWISQHDLKFREDATNAEAHATRNKLRLELLPALSEALGRDVRPALCRAAEISRAELEWLDALALPAASHDALDARTLGAQPLAMQRRVIFLWLTQRGLPGIGFDAVESVRAMLDLRDGPARVNLPGNRFVQRRRGSIRAEAQAPHSREFP